MFSEQRIIWSFLILGILAVLTNSATGAATRNKSDIQRFPTYQEHFQRQFQAFMAHFAYLFKPRTGHSQLLGAMLRSSSRRAPPQSWSAPRHTDAVQAGDPQAEDTICQPPCQEGRQCCLLQPRSSVASCHRMVLSGQECDGYNLTGASPGTTVAVRSSTCPCFTGMWCLGARARQRGTCSFL